MNVLVPVDDSDPARAAFEYAVSNAPDTEITALHVIDPYETSVSSWLGGQEFPKKLEEEGSELLAELEAVAADHDVTIETDTVVGKPAQEITTYVENEDIDEVVIGSHGRTGSSRVLLGSVAETVVRRAPVPVTVVR
ncbi:universal stress protein [Natrarchaeobaculum sulfurireducens]|uniref:Universal stress protein n=1 Tax=Natrarchaeobaculum sulfurireducens TaxID=2044521 RepID=A0A346PPI2_9EURY|nr:universal stress protein [Natrarchaeobaculum sulfurireducens]AXR81427.1 Universal stress protein [Natrarchaeobaculum sulfurireducens]